MLLGDDEIRRTQMFSPFHEGVSGEGILSSGLSSAGYDISLSSVEMFVFEQPSWWKRLWWWLTRRPIGALDPKKFDRRCLKRLELQSGENGDRFFVLPPKSISLGVSVERIKVGDEYLMLALCKSTYARLGIQQIATPFEPGWEGYPTLEFVNSSPFSVRLYAQEGVVQCLTFLTTGVSKTYAGKQGKYQHQPKEVVTAR